MDNRKAARSAVDFADEVESPEFRTLLDADVDDRAHLAAVPAAGMLVGRLVGFASDGTIPLVTYPGQPGTSAILARSTVDLHAAHVGSAAVLLFEANDPARPIVVGCVRQASDTVASESQTRVEVDADGERLIVYASHRLVLRCGKASITLSRDGEVVVRGTRVVSHASGLNRVKGGSVQIN